MYRSQSLAFLFLVMAMLSSVFAWEGRDTTTGASVEIGSGNLVREGETIEVYDGEYKSMDISTMRRFGGSVEIQGTDSETGEERVLEMDD